MRKFLGKSSGAWLGVAQLPDGSKGEHKVSLGPNDKGEKEREEAAVPEDMVRVGIKGEL